MGAIGDGAGFDRRSLLGMVSASPFVSGLAELLGGAEDRADQDRGAGKASRPAWFRAALRRARERGVPLLAFVTPDLSVPERATAALRAEKARFKGRLTELVRGGATGEAAPGGKGGLAGADPWFTIRFEDRLDRFAVYLQLLLDSERVDLRELFLDSVCVCAPAAWIGAEASETAVVLDGEGRRVRGVLVDLGDPEQVATRVSALLHGGGRLRERAERVRTPALTGALGLLSSSDARELAQAKAWLVDNIDRCSAAVVYERRSNPARRAMLGEVVGLAYRRRAAKEFQGVLPFGVEYEPRQVYDPCPPCGMARVPQGSRKMLKLIAAK